MPLPPTDLRHADHLAQVIDSIGATVLSAQGAQVGHVSVFRQKGMGILVRRVRLPHHLAPVVECVGPTLLPSQGAQVGENIGLSETIVQNQTQHGNYHQAASPDANSLSHRCLLRWKQYRGPPSFKASSKWRKSVPHSEFFYNVAFAYC